ncbi:MAG: MarR family winged helix-turn-helix transcriptional regulator [Candidatus Omnitrophota bacterium]
MTDIKTLAAEVSVVGPRIGRSIMMRIVQAYDISHSQLFALMTLQEAGGMRISDLANSLQVSAPTITGVISRLEREKYVQRTPDPEDRRAVHVQLTAKGRSTVRRIRRIAQKRWAEILSHVSEKEAEAFVKNLKMIANYV